MACNPWNDRIITITKCTKIVCNIIQANLKIFINLMGGGYKQEINK